MVKIPRRTAWTCTSAFVMVLTVLMWVAAPWKAEPSRKTPPSADHQPRISEAYGRIPLHFEANHGQTDDRVKFVTRGRGYTMFLTSNEAVLALRRPEAREEKDRSARRRAELPGKMSQTVLRMTYAGENPNPRIVGQDELPSKANYFKGNDPAKWRTNVPTFARVRYEEVYPGIDLVFYGNQRALEYDFVVKPGADPARIALGFEGAEKIEIDAQGDLLLHTGHGALRQRKPFIYQEVEGVRREIPGRYVVAENDTVSFQVAAYDSSRPLVIDPTLFYSTFLGGSGDETGIAIAVDADGEAYVTGNVSSLDFPTVNAFDATLSGSSDAYVTKLDATGSAVVYSTYLGGSGGDVGLSIAVDGFGSAYATGGTGSSDFPLANPMQANPMGAFVTKLSPSGSALVYSTYNDIGRGIAVDLAGSAYVAGGGSDAIVEKLNPTGSALVYRVLFGGSLPDTCVGIAVDATGNAYVAGETQSTDFPTTPGAPQGTFGGFVDAFVSKLDPTGATLVYSTYLGGSEFDFGAAIAVDPAVNAYVTGFTPSLDFPLTVNAVQSAFGGGGGDAFVTKLNAAGTAFVYSTYLGGTEVEEGRGIAVDAAGSAFVLGRTASEDFPTVPGSFQNGFGGVEDSFVTRLSPDGSELLYSTYLGGSGEDANNGAIALDDFLNPNAYVVGSTTSTDFPTTADAFDTTYNGGVDVFVTQIIDVMLPPQPTTGRVRGQGVVPVPGGTGRFHLIVRRRTDGTLDGRVKYRNRATGAEMTSETITSLVIAGNAARIDGTCGTLCAFTVEVTDVDDGPNDTFTISINGGPPEGGTLQKGDIRIQQ